MYIEQGRDMIVSQNHRLNDLLRFQRILFTLPLIQNYITLKKMKELKAFEQVLKSRKAKIICDLMMSKSWDTLSVLRYSVYMTVSCIVSNSWTEMMMVRRQRADQQHYNNYSVWNLFYKPPPKNNSGLIIVFFCAWWWWHFIMTVIMVMLGGVIMITVIPSNGSYFSYFPGPGQRHW